MVDIKEIKTEDLNISNMLKKVPNRFVLCIGLFKRARQLKEGLKPMVKYDSEKPVLPVLTAMKELLEDKLDINFIKNDFEESELIDKMEQQLEEEIKNEKEELEKEKTVKKKTKEGRAKSKSKSLAA
jgi:DNA-directed RNA polymerase omega subunit